MWPGRLDGAGNAPGTSCGGVEKPDASGAPKLLPGGDTLVEDVTDCGSPKGRVLGVNCLDWAGGGGDAAVPTGGGDTEGVGAPDVAGDLA